MAKKKSKGWITAENAAGEPVGSTVGLRDRGDRGDRGTSIKK